MRYSIHNQDCRDWMASAEPESVDLVVTSPPYDDLRTYEGTLNWNAEIWQGVLRGLWRVIKPGGVVVWIVNDAIVDGSETGTSFRQALFAKELGFNINDTMIWNKCGFANPGNFNARYPQVFEYMFVFSKGYPKTFNYIKDRKNKHAGQLIKGTQRLSDGQMKKKCNYEKHTQEYGSRFNIWDMNGEASDGHPAPFPEALAADHIRSWSNEGDLVFDPFCGSGTTGVAAQKLNRDFIGCEIVPKYAELSERRLANACPLFADKS